MPVNPKLMQAVAVLGAALLLFCHDFAYSADSGVQKRYPLPDGGALQLSVPQGWSEKIEQPSKTAPPMITFGARTGKPFIVNITPMPPSADVAAPTPENLRKRVEGAL